MSRMQFEPASAGRLTPGIAVLVDGENVNTGPASEVLRGVGGAEKAAIRRVYGNAPQLAKWGEMPGFRLIHTAMGKNSADMRLSIDAVHLSHQGGIERFVIVTSDGDFSHLAHHLRERHFQVIGIGEAKTPEAFRASCSQFIEIEAREVQAPAQVKPRTLCKMDARVRDAILNGGGATGLPIQRLGPALTPHGISISTHKDKRWRTYLENRPILYACDPKGPDARDRWVGPQA